MLAKEGCLNASRSCQIEVMKGFQVAGGRRYTCSLHDKTPSLVSRIVGAEHQEEARYSSHALRHWLEEPPSSIHPFTQVS